MLIGSFWGIEETHLKVWTTHWSQRSGTATGPGCLQLKHFQDFSSSPSLSSHHFSNHFKFEFLPPALKAHELNWIFNLYFFSQKKFLLIVAGFVLFCFRLALHLPW